jgi:hypothetical protein
MRSRFAADVARVADAPPRGGRGDSSRRSARFSARSNLVLGRGSDAVSAARE